VGSPLIALCFLAWCYGVALLWLVCLSSSSAKWHWQILSWTLFSTMLVGLPMYLNSTEDWQAFLGASEAEARATSAAS